MDRRFEQVDRRFDQINSRLQPMDVVSEGRQGLGNVKRMRLIPAGIQS